MRIAASQGWYVRIAPKVYICIIVANINLATRLPTEETSFFVSTEATGQL
jgi:hypothetical protein